MSDDPKAANQDVPADAGRKGGEAGERITGGPETGTSTIAKP